MNNKIENPAKTNFLISNLTELWEKSVRATHHFLAEDDIIKLTPFVIMGLNEIETLVVKFENDIPIAFMGIENHKIEMLFVTPEQFNKGVGREFIELALSKFAVEYVDVNEQNPQAVGFYKHMGFEAFERTEFDEQGNPFPILKMKR